MALHIFSDTNPVLLFNPNENRTRLAIQFRPFDVDSNNDGTVSFGFGFQPTANVDEAKAGEVLTPAASIDRPGQSGVLSEKYKRAIWARSSKANQSITYEEETAEPNTDTQ